MHPPALTSRGDDSRPAEIRQVPGDFWLAHPQDIHQVADANLLVGDQIEKTKPRAIGQGAKEQIEREWLFFPRHPHIIYGLGIGFCSTATLGCVVFPAFTKGTQPGVAVLLFWQPVKPATSANADSTLECRDG